MTITDLYIKLNEGKVTKKQFIEAARKDPSLKKWVTNLMDYNGIVKVLKFNNIIHEISKPSKKQLLSEDLRISGYDAPEFMRQDSDPVGRDSENFVNMLKHARLNQEKVEQIKDIVSDEIRQGIEDLEDQFDGHVEDDEFRNALVMLLTGKLGFEPGKKHMAPGSAISPNLDTVRHPELNEGLDPGSVNYQEYIAGIRYEYICTVEKEHGKVDINKIINKVIKNLSKEPYYYTNLVYGIQSPTSKKKRTDQMVPVKKDNFVDKDNAMKPFKKKP